MANTIDRNIQELNRAFERVGEDLRKERDRMLKQLAVPVDRDAETFARARIRNVGRAWSEIRIGVLTNSVYIAPVKRGTRVHSMKRPKFAGLLMGKAMRPALNANKERVTREFDQLLDRLVRGFNG